MSTAVIARRACPDLSGIGNADEKKVKLFFKGLDSRLPDFVTTVIARSETTKQSLEVIGTEEIATYLPAGRCHLRFLAMTKTDYDTDCLRE
ncbi:MAG: hypothetical protein JSU99_00950 [Nitrospiraceae bacterium]|nr:MAG: hypothetical protein JSU99_00950 [Nitrospiraceae bacterium]